MISGSEALRFYGLGNDRQNPYATPPEWRPSPPYYPRVDGSPEDFAKWCAEMRRLKLGEPE